MLDFEGAFTTLDEVIVACERANNLSIRPRAAGPGRAASFEVSDLKTGWRWMFGIVIDRNETEVPIRGTDTVPLEPGDNIVFVPFA